MGRGSFWLIVLQIINGIQINYVSGVMCLACFGKQLEQLTNCHGVSLIIGLFSSSLAVLQHQETSSAETTLAINSHSV